MIDVAALVVTISQVVNNVKVVSSLDVVVNGGCSYIFRLAHQHMKQHTIVFENDILDMVMIIYH